MCSMCGPYRGLNSTSYLMLWGPHLMASIKDPQAEKVETIEKRHGTGQSTRGGSAVNTCAKTP